MGARLVEMDRLLRDIQVELAPEREPAPALTDPVPAADHIPVPDDVPARHQVPAPDPPIQALSDLSARLLASTRELLAGYEQVLVGRPPAPPPARRAVRRRPDAPDAPDAPDVTLSAAPFANLEALREFEQAVSGLPGVREVTVQGYEGSDRAIIVVRLDQPNP
ncbi:MAG: hypothetical protein JO027_07035 [Solirubrobacterales bacterium]|nr:hypothetical protein [Solirubrobacterales bacterium]